MPPHPCNVHYLRNVLAGSVLAGGTPPVSRKTKPKRIFLSRAKIGTRLAINADEFEQFLREHDFSTVDMAELTVVQQRAMFADVDVVLGALGSDLLAVYFAPPQCTVISMQCDMDSDRCAPPTAVILGMKHQFLVCTNSRPSKHARNTLDRDFVVDCGELSRRLREIDAAPSE